MSIAENVEEVRRRLREACARAGRDPGEVTLIAISKTFPLDAIEEAWAAGVRDFGENRVQEAKAKILAAREAGLRPTWHLVGSLQRNKVKDALALFDILHSVDSVPLAEEIARRAHAQVPVLIEVNVSGEPTKHGFAPRDVDGAIEALRALPLRVRGLMAIAPRVPAAEDARPYFRQLAGLARRHGLSELSMGMTEDFEIAIEEGATMIRVGRAIFGERTTP